MSCLPAFAFADPETQGHCDDASLSFWCHSQEAFLLRAFVCLFEMASHVVLAGLELGRQVRPQTQNVSSAPAPLCWGYRYEPACCPERSISTQLHSVASPCCSPSPAHYLNLGMILLWIHSHSVILGLSESRECMKVTIACLHLSPSVLLGRSVEIHGKCGSGERHSAVMMASLFLDKLIAT